MADKTSEVSDGDALLIAQYNDLRGEVLNPSFPMNRVGSSLSFAGVNGASDGISVTSDGTLQSAVVYTGDITSFEVRASVAGSASFYLPSTIYAKFTVPWEMTIISGLGTTYAGNSSFSGLAHAGDVGTTLPIGTSHNFAGVRCNSSGVHFVNGNGTNEASTTFTPANPAASLHNCSIKYNGTNLKFYNNGTLVATHTTYLPTVSGSPVPYHIGDSTGAGSAQDNFFYFGSIYREEIGGA